MEWIFFTEQYAITALRFVKVIGSADVRCRIKVSGPAATMIDLRTRASIVPKMGYSNTPRTTSQRLDLSCLQCAGM
jgi:hypothetical protein